MNLVGAICLGLVLLLALVALGSAFYRRVRIVKEEERIVVYRRGRFDRIDGPGWTFLGPYETIERTLNVRDQPKTASVAQLFLYGIPIGFTFSFWARVDPVVAAGGSAARLKDMAMFEDYERDQQVDLKIRDSFVRRVAELEKGRSLSTSATIVEKVIPILPGSPECTWLLNQVRNDLVRTLPLVGVFLNTTHPMTVNGIIIPPEMMAGFTRGRMKDLLKLYFPDLPEERLAQMVGSIEGWETMRRYDFEQKGSAAQQVVPEMRIGNAEEGMKVKLQSPPQPQPAEPRADDVARAARARERPVPVYPVQKPVDGSRARPSNEPLPEKLAKSDLSYLKSVPPKSQEERSVA
jgi:hypothetical protein